MSEHLPVPARRGSELATDASSDVRGDRAPRAPLHERMLAYGAITVMVSEDMDVSGYGPERYRVAIGGQPVEVVNATFGKSTGERVLLTNLGNIVIPGAQQRARGAKVTVGGLAVPGA